MAARRHASKSYFSYWGIIRALFTCSVHSACAKSFFGFYFLPVNPRADQETVRKRMPNRLFIKVRLQLKRPLEMVSK